MAIRKIPGNEALAKRIRNRRQELGLTIEEAASRAGVGIKTWSRYEAGESIRQDKAKGVCKALNWQRLSEEEDEDIGLDVEEYKKHEAWSKYLEKRFGIQAAMAFVIGSDLLWDHINEDLEELSTMPKGSHIGQLGVSWIKDDMPAQFLTRYDYEFLYRMRWTLKLLVLRAHAGSDMTAHSVLEELVIYLCNEQAAGFFELVGDGKPETGQREASYDEWVFDLFEDSDLLMFLYSNWYLEEDNIYHFSHWGEEQFWRRNQE